MREGRRPFPRGPNLHKEARLPSVSQHVRKYMALAPKMLQVIIRSFTKMLSHFSKEGLLARQLCKALYFLNSPAEILETKTLKEGNDTDFSTNRYTKQKVERVDIQYTIYWKPSVRKRMLLHTQYSFTFLRGIQRTVYISFIDNGSGYVVREGYSNPNFI